jgi:hypothetical protein
MAHLPQIKIPATYMRGGTSKGVFFRLQDLPEHAQVPGAARDALLLRVIGSPDPYGKQIDGMGGATSSTSKTVILARSSKADHDIEGLRRLERQLRQFICRGRTFRDRRRSHRSQPRTEEWRCHCAHMAGEHQQDHYRVCTDQQRRPAGDW